MQNILKIYSKILKKICKNLFFSSLATVERIAKIKLMY